MLACVPNVSEGRRADVLRGLRAACGPSLLDSHVDPDHDRAVFTLAGPGPRDAEFAVRALSHGIAAGGFDLHDSNGVHPRLGILDVVPFVALDRHRDVASRAAIEFGTWLAHELWVPVFLYDDADPAHRTLPSVRRDAFGLRSPDAGPSNPHPRLGAAAVGARPPMIAVNCELDRDDLALARRVASRVREHDAGLPGVRALGFELASRGRAQVSMNLVDLDVTGLEEACGEVRKLVRAAGAEVARIEIVGLIPAAELDRCSTSFKEWSGVGPERTIEAAMARVAVDGGTVAPSGA